VIVGNLDFEFFWWLFFCDTGKIDLHNGAWFASVAIRIR